MKFDFFYYRKGTSATTRTRLPRPAPVFFWPLRFSRFVYLSSHRSSFRRRWDFWFLPLVPSLSLRASTRGKGSPSKWSSWKRFSLAESALLEASFAFVLCLSLARSWPRLLFLPENQVLLPAEGFLLPATLIFNHFSCPTVGARCRLLTNIAVDITAIAVSVGLVKRDLDAQEGRMARMEIGAKLAGLKVRLQTKEDLSTVTLAALRRDRGRDKRVAVLVGGADAVNSSLESALPYGAALETSDILIVPLVLESRPGMSGGGAAMFQASGAENDMGSAVGSAHVALPVALNRWQEYIDSEVSAVMVGVSNCLVRAIVLGLDPLCWHSF